MVDYSRTLLVNIVNIQSVIEQELQLAGKTQNIKGCTSGAFWNCKKKWNIKSYEKLIIFFSTDLWYATIDTANY